MSSRVSRKAKFMSIFFSDKSRELRNIIGETVIIAVAISGLSLAETAIVSVQRLLLLRSLARQKEEKAFGTSTPPLLTMDYYCFTNNVSQTFGFIPRSTCINWLSVFSSLSERRASSARTNTFPRFVEPSAYSLRLQQPAALIAGARLLSAGR